MKQEDTSSLGDPYPRTLYLKVSGEDFVLSMVLCDETQTELKVESLAKLIAVCELMALTSSIDGFQMGEQDLGALVEELLLDWLDPFLTVEEQDRLLVWHLGVCL